MPFAWTPRADLRLKLPDGELEAQVWGPRPSDAPTIVMLHEGLGCVRLWRDLPEQLARHTSCGVFAYSRFGYGTSDPRPLPWPLDYMSVEAREVLPRVLDAVRPTSAILLGHSDGATITALHQGEAIDERVRGMVLLAPHFFVEDCSIDAITAAGNAFAGSLRDKLARYHRHVDCAFFGWHDSWLAPGFRDWNVSETIDHWKVPCLAIQGLDDPYGTRAQVDVIAKRQSPSNAVHLLERCQHAPHQEQAERTMALIKSFAEACLDPPGR